MKELPSGYTREGVDLDELESNVVLLGIVGIEVKASILVGFTCKLLTLSRILCEMVLPNPLLSVKELVLPCEWSLVTMSRRPLKSRPDAEFYQRKVSCSKALNLKK